MRALSLCLAVLALFGAAIDKLVGQMARLGGDLSVYYHAANELLSGLSPYHGPYYIYPPLWAWLIAPICILPPRGYAMVWGVTLGLSWIAGWLLCVRLVEGRGPCGHRFDPGVHLLPTVLLFRCIWNGWGHGQLSLLLFALVMATFVAEREGHDGRAAFLLALAGAVKLFPLFLGLIFLRPRRWRAVLLLGLFFAGFSILPVLEVGPRTFESLVIDGFFGIAMKELREQDLWPMNHSPVPHLFVARGWHVPHEVRKGCWVFLLVVTAAALLVRRPVEDRARDDLWLSFLVTSSLVACPHVWMHYFTLLLFPFYACLSYVRSRPRETTSRILIVAVGVASAAFNANSTLFMSKALSDMFDRAGLLAAGLFLFWLGLLAALVAAPARPETA